MTLTEFRAVGLALYGYNWQKAMARALGVNPRTIRKWLAGEAPLPAWLPEKLGALQGATDAAPPPRDEWIVGEGKQGREYVIHALPPRFVARAARTDEDGRLEQGEAEADLLSGVTYGSDLEGITLCEIQWIDPAPAAAALSNLLDRACDAVAEFEDREEDDEEARRAAVRAGRMSED